MATNRTPLEAIAYAKRFVKNFKIDDSDLKIRVLNAANHRLHMFAPWEWAAEQVTLDADPALVNGTADYDFTVNSPDTYFDILKAELFHTTDNRAEPLKPVTLLPSQDRHNGTPKLISRVDSNTLRLYPIPQMGTSAPDLICWMRLKNPEIVEDSGSPPATANDSASDGLLFPDEWFWVYSEIVLLYAMRFADDPKAGSANVRVNTDGQIVKEYTGQFGVVQDALTYMASKEDMLIQGVGEVVNG